ncbi:hypothetical protein VCHA53O466_50302 [Vibrio chagasii]|nr:hypothetical protein VCHA53O466_50302 [Vibrio chagasii]
MSRHRLLPWLDLESTSLQGVEQSIEDALDVQRGFILYAGRAIKEQCEAWCVVTQSEVQGKVNYTPLTISNLLPHSCFTLIYRFQMNSKNSLC